MTIYDNDGRSFDRYTVILDEYGYALGIGATGNVPNGFCMALDLDEIVEGPHLGRKITLDDMTDAARRAVLDEIAWAKKESANYA